MTTLDLGGVRLPDKSPDVGSCEPNGLKKESGASLVEQFNIAAHEWRCERNPCARSGSPIGRVQVFLWLLALWNRLSIGRSASREIFHDFPSSSGQLSGGHLLLNKSIPSRWWFNMWKLRHSLSMYILFPSLSIFIYTQWLYLPLFLSLSIYVYVYVHIYIYIVKGISPLPTGSPKISTIPDCQKWKWSHHWNDVKDPCLL